MSQTKSIKSKVMGVRLPLTLIQAIKLRATAEGKTYSEWAQAVLEAALQGGTATAAPIVSAKPDMLETMLTAILQMQQRLDVLEHRALFPAPVPAAPQPVATTATEEPTELAEIFNALSDAIGEEDIEICLNQPLASKSIDIWIPAANLALMTTTRYSVLTGKELSAYHAELNAFAPGARAVPVSLANIQTIAERVLLPAVEQEPAEESLPKSWRAEVKEIITSPEFMQKHRKKGFKAYDIAAVMGVELTLKNIACVRGVLKSFVKEGRLSYKRLSSSNKAGAYSLK